MSFFKSQQPILQKKQLSFNSQDLFFLKCLRIKPLELINLSGIYTCIDQAMIVWGVVAGFIFISAQFLPINWHDQAIFWSIITGIGIILMIILTYGWTVAEKVSWLLYTWVFLMVLGIVVTDCSIVLHWGFVLSRLCDLWLIICALGYGITAWGMRSRAFLISSIIHLFSVGILPLVGGWEFAVTGLIMMSNLLVFAEVQWDMWLVNNLTNWNIKQVTNFEENSKNLIFEGISNK